MNIKMSPLLALLLLFTFPGSIFSFPWTLPPAGRTISITGFQKLPLPHVLSTGGMTFDLSNGGPYVGTSDGRILKYNKLRGTFQNFAYTSPNRTKKFCDGVVNLEKLQTCGYPDGLSTDRRTGIIYVVDISLGVGKLKPSGGLATNLVESDGVTYQALASIDAASNCQLYFVDGSTKYDLKGVNTSVQSDDTTGKLLAYDPRTKNVTEILTKLEGPLGVATDSNASSAIFTEFTGGRIRKYYISGQKAGQSEVLLSGTGRPYQIKRINGEDNFWVAINYEVNQTYVSTGALKISSTGQIIAVLDFSPEINQELVSTVLQQNDQLYVATLNGTFIGKYNLINV